MKILHILPEFEEGGVERHVLMLAGQQKEAGHDVFVVSAGGKLDSQLIKGVRHFNFPVHRKNPVTGFYCAVLLNSLVRKNTIEVIHAHSRVPAWIAMFTSRLAGVPYIVTAHAYFSNQARWIYVPYRRAHKVICVSKAVKKGMKNCFAKNTVVVPNGMPPVETSWQGSGEATVNFLFVGRLTQLKGLQDIIGVLPELSGDWKLDVVGDGPLRAQLEEKAKSLGLTERVIFYGFQNDPDAWMEKSDCLLFPSYIEGMPLTLARAIQLGLPVIASDIEPIRELALGNEGLVKPGDLMSWKNALDKFIVNKLPPADFDKKAIPTIQQMTQEVLRVYSTATKA